jgi:hypothetical protein
MARRAHVAIDVGTGSGERAAIDVAEGGLTDRRRATEPPTHPAATARAG